jgi:hypothetical protein
VAAKFSSSIQARGIWRIFHWVSVFLFRLGLGGLAGERYLLLEYKTGEAGGIRRVLLEIIRYDPCVEVLYVVPAFGAGVKWIAYVKKHPDVRINARGKAHFALGVVLNRDRSAAEVLDFAHRNPELILTLARSVFGSQLGEKKEELLELANNLPVVRLHIIKPEMSKTR